MTSQFLIRYEFVDPIHISFSSSTTQLYVFQTQKDLLVLPMPYNDMSSDEVKRWEKTLSKGEEIDDEIYPEFSQIE